MKLSTILPALCLLFATSAQTEAAPPANQSATTPAASAQRLDKELTRETEARLKKLLLDRPVIAKVAFPATESGIDLLIDGNWDVKKVLESIEKEGIGVARAATASITDVKLKSKHIEIHLDGGGGVQKLATSSFGVDDKPKAPKTRRGSRINLRFDRQLTTDDVQDLNRVLSYLEPVIDPSLIRQYAKNERPSESAAGIRRGPVVPGMVKREVVAALGYPRYRKVDASGAPPIEKWHYDLPENKTRVIAFQEDKVLMVDEF